MNSNSSILKCKNSSDQSEILVKLLRDLIAEARRDKVTGRGTIEIDFHQGGVAKKKVGLTKNIS